MAAEVSAGETWVEGASMAGGISEAETFNEVTLAAGTLATEILEEATSAAEACPAADFTPPHAPASSLKHSRSIGLEGEDSEEKFDQEIRELFINPAWEAISASEIVPRFNRVVAFPVLS